MRDCKKKTMEIEKKTILDNFLYVFLLCKEYWFLDIAGENNYAESVEYKGVFGIKRYVYIFFSMMT